MQKGHISRHFEGVAAKRLALVEANPSLSRQHELDGVRALKDILGTRKRVFPATFIYLADDPEDVITSAGTLTWYDARERQPHRAAEYRLYFTGTAVSEVMRPNDLVVVAKLHGERLLFIVAPNGTTVENQILWLFDLPLPNEKFTLNTFSDRDPKLGATARLLLDQLGIEPEPEPAAENYLEEMLRRFKNGFPTTKVFSEFARGTLPLISAAEDPDTAVTAWWEREDSLFRTFERHWVAQRLREGFGLGNDDVDAFVQFSLSVHNRRKSRAGLAAENHLEAVFSANDVRYSRTPRTEGKSRPDFVFPGEKEYHRRAFPAGRLTMLGVKTTCKERWRQILPEADRIEEKHLFTLEAGISKEQTEQMASLNVVLVLPQSLHRTYQPQQHSVLLNVSTFIALVRARQ